MKSIKWLFAGVLLLGISFVLAACGGGGGGGSAPPATYTISGVVSGATTTGVTINLTGASTATTTTATDGSYSFTGLANGSYTVTPSKSLFTFNPTSLAVSVSGANVTGRNFTAISNPTGITYSISGTVSGASGVTINLSGDNTGSVVTGGTYTFSGLVAGSYTVTPSLSGYTFSPTNRAITLSADSTANDFVAMAIPVAYSISGNVSGTTGVTITVTGGTANTGAITDGSGNYTVTGLYDGNYTVTPSKTGFTFNPISTAVPISGANVTGKNFTATANTAPTYTLSGAVSGPYFEGVTITMTGDGTGTTTTNASGNYSFANLPAGTYTLTPSLAGYTYSPAAPAVAVSANTVQNFTASSAVVSYSISGTVSETTAKTGRIYIQAYWSTCPDCGPVAGTSLASAGTYTIRGLQSGDYVVVAGMDYMDTGAINATNPAGGPVAATIASANLAGVNITVADRTLPAPVTPTGLMIFPSSGAAFVVWDTPWNANYEEIATSYKIYWGTDTAASNGGTITVAARDDAHYLQAGLTNGAMYYKITALVDATESTASTVVAVTIGATTGANTVSGTVTFPGTATGPMVVGVYSDTIGIYFTTIASPVSPQSYSVAGVTDGSYDVFAVIDMNSNGVFGSGDIGSTEDNPVTVSGNTNTTKNLTLSSASASAKVTTDHQFDGTNHNYQVQSEVEDGVKRAVAVTLVSGLNVAVPSDMGKEWNFQMNQWLGATSPTVGDSYVFKVTYSDATTETLSGSVTAVLGTTAMAQNLAAVTDGTGGSSASVPLFTWAAPASPPATYTYRVNLYGNDANWWYPQDNGLPSTTTPLQVLYNADGRASKASLTQGTTYTWQVKVQDAARNSATRQATYSY